MHLYDQFNYGSAPTEVKPVQQKPTQFQQQAADEEWDCQLKNDTVQGLAPKHTGIYDQWLAGYIQGIFYGPPVGHERNCTDWQGNPIIKQQFLYAHVEWRNGLLGWYPYYKKGN